MEAPVIGYKLFTQHADGSIGPLFINARQRITIGELLPAEDHPTKGFAHRPGWHCTFQPVAPHLAIEPKGKRPRVWMRVEMYGVTRYARPESQGGTWGLATAIRVLGPA